MPVPQWFLTFLAVGSLFFLRITLILANNRETGSYLTAHTTIQSYETANPGADSR